MLRIFKLCMRCFAQPTIADISNDVSPRFRQFFDLTA